MNDRSNERMTTKNDILKLFGIITMAIDHIGLIFFPDHLLFRYIGRLAFPIFAYHIATGTRYTSNLKTYRKRLWTFALLSQLPYTLAFQSYMANVLFTFLLATFFIEKWETKRYGQAGSLALVAFLLPLDYGLYGVLLTFIFYYFHQQPSRMIMAAAGLNLLILAFFPPFQTLSMLGVLLCLVPFQNVRIQLPKMFFYLFYPMHLLILWMVHLQWN
jgi:hypothetical protein